MCVARRERGNDEPVVYVYRAGDNRSMGPRGKQLPECRGDEGWGDPVSREEFGYRIGGAKSERGCNRGVARCRDVKRSATTDAEIFRPAEVQKATYAVYPANTVASGTVVFDVKVGADGNVAGARVLGGGAGTPVSGAATRAIRGWTFTPGSYRKAMATRVVVAFVFASPALGTR